MLPEEEITTYVIKIPRFTQELCAQLNSLVLCKAAEVLFTIRGLKKQELIIKKSM